MLLSSGVVWRHREWDDFRADCPGGDEALQRLVWERLDDALAWLESLGAEPVWTDTENPRTTGSASTRGRSRSCSRRARTSRLETPLPPTPSRRSSSRRGGFGGRLARERGLAPAREPVERGRRRSTWRSRAARRSRRGWDEFYGRAMPARPARIREEDFVPLAQLYGREARVFADDGRDITPPTVAWHENDLAQLIGPTRVVRASRHERADRGGARRGRNRRRSGRAGRDAGGAVAVHVAGAVTHTIGGIARRHRARVVTGARRRLGRGRRRGRHRDRRLLERPRAGARARPRRGRIPRPLASAAMTDGHQTSSGRRAATSCRSATETSLPSAPRSRRTARR